MEKFKVYNPRKFAIGMILQNGSERAIQPHSFALLSRDDIEYLASIAPVLFEGEKLLRLEDRALSAQMGIIDSDAQPALDFTQSFQWQFEPVGEAFSAVDLAAGVAGKGSLPAVYNAVNEEAAAAFLAGKIKFPQIVDCVTEVVDSASAFAGVPSSVEDVLEVEAEARKRAHDVLSAWSSR